MIAYQKTPACQMNVFILGMVLALSAQLQAATIPISTPIPNDVPALTVDEVNTIITQGVGYLKSVKLSGIIAVTDREGHILAIFRMT